MVSGRRLPNLKTLGISIPESRRTRLSEGIALYQSLYIRHIAIDFISVGYGIGLSSTRLIWVLFVSFLILAPAARATAATGGICDSAANRAAAESGVPAEVLLSITRTETGRNREGRLEPWPWTVNMEGTGRWFSSEDEARAYVFHHFKRGARSFDVGCFQINYRWHGQAFSSIDQMFDPLENARYAAGFLKSLHSETGNWSKAAGAYHSRTDRHATRYRARFDRIRAALDPQRAPQLAESHLDEETVTRAARPNAYPLLHNSGNRRGHGSLVPLDDGPVQALFSASDATPAQ